MARHYPNYHDIQKEDWPWPNFTPKEMACPHCSAIVVDSNAMNRIQAARYLYGQSIVIASAYRCEEHNKKVGGGENSAHLRGVAVDAYPGRNGNLAEMLDAFNQVGWLGHGMGAKKIHFDWDEALGKRAWFYGE